MLAHAGLSSGHMPSAAPTLKTIRPAGLSRALRVGFLPLTDAAPLIAAQELGLFTRHGLQVELQREIGWATIAHKVVCGELDAAPAPAPLLWAAQLGLGYPRGDAVTALVLSRHGNAVTLSRRLWEAGVRDPASLRDHFRSRRERRVLTFGMVSAFSSHHLLLRQWLAHAGLVPDRDVCLVVVPPAQVFRNLQAGTIDGFCAGEPWNTHAIRAGLGWSPMWSSTEDPGHVEKVLMVTRDFTREHAAKHAGLIHALTEAAAWCDEPHHRETLAGMLAADRYLKLPAETILPSLVGRFDAGCGRVESAPDFHVFHRGDAGRPTGEEAEALQSALIAAGVIPAATDPLLPRRVFCPDLHREILAQLPNTHEILASSNLSGVVNRAR